MDANGDVWVADNDDLNIYRFTNAQINTAISGTPLTMANGALIANLGVSASLAVDIASNRLYAAGYQTNGIQVYDIVTHETGTLTPGADNTNYQVMSFADGVNGYIGWMTRSGWNGGDTVTYGYDIASQVAVPEPSAFFLGICAGLAIYFLSMFRQKYRRL